MQNEHGLDLQSRTREPLSIRLWTQYVHTMWLRAVLSTDDCAEQQNLRTHLQKIACGWRGGWDMKGYFLFFFEASYFLEFL